MEKLVGVNQLVAGNILSNSVNSMAGKVLLGKDIVLTARHISLLSAWDIESVFINVDKEEDEEDLQEKIQNTHSVEYFQFLQEYNNIMTTADQAFELIAKKKLVPIAHLKDTAGNIYSSVSNNTVDIMNYLLVSGDQLSGFTCHHSVMVAYFASLIARQMRWSQKDVAGVALASLLHDIGSLITDNTSTKNNPFHIAETASLLKGIKGLPNEIILGIIQHRECMNSSGFPTGAKGAQIHPYAKIIAVADIFQNSTYQDEGANPFPMLDMLSREMYGKFDTDVCQHFILRVRDSLLFNKILLSTGEEAEVIFFNLHSYAMPIVKTVANEIIDLSKQKDIKIIKMITSS